MAPLPGQPALAIPVNRHGCLADVKCLKKPDQPFCSFPHVSLLGIKHELRMKRRLVHLINSRDG